MLPGISLANKCQLIFGFSIVVILAAALSVPWVGTRKLVDDYQVEVARQIADAWLADRIELGTLQPRGMPPLLGLGRPAERDDEQEHEHQLLRLTFVRVDEIDAAADGDAFVSTAVSRFQDDPSLTEHVTAVPYGDQTVYRYARALHTSQMQRIRDFSVSGFTPAPFEPELADPLQAILIVDRSTQFAEGQRLRGQIYIITALLIGGLLAILIFYLLLTKLIFSPVRRLRETAEKVQDGDLTMRSEIRTGDEFEQLADAFNTMLDQVVRSQEQLQAINESLDLKVDELADANVTLYESNRLKSEFLANVSHELRTPLNSIIGFAELLQELAQSDDGADPKRRRYLENILSSGRSLLEMINELLDMAKIEAGRLEVNIEQTSVADLIEGLMRIMGPQAVAGDIVLQDDVATNVPMVESDPGKLQQILYNFLSNAVKFTPPGGQITVSANRVRRQDNTLGVRLAVRDTGPGIPEDMQDVIFEKFRQVDAGHTREHPGTGLGLAICRELAGMLGAEVSFVSEPGHGATFFVDLPCAYRAEEPRALMAP